MRLRSERLTWREVDGELVALDVESSSYFTANSTASVLVKRLANGPATEEDLAEMLVGEFDVDPETALVDVARFIGVLDGQGLLVREGA